jgi:hypothetical protein
MILLGPHAVCNSPGSFRDRKIGIGHIFNGAKLYPLGIVVGRTAQVHELEESFLTRLFSDTLHNAH